MIRSFLVAVGVVTLANVILVTFMVAASPRRRPGGKDPGGAPSPSGSTAAPLSHPSFLVWTADELSSLRWLEDNTDWQFAHIWRDV